MGALDQVENIWSISTGSNLETCISDALCQLLVKYYIVKVLIVQSNVSFATKHKNQPFHNTRFIELLLRFDTNSSL